MISYLSCVDTLFTYMLSGQARVRKSGGWSMHREPVAVEPIPSMRIASSVYGVDTNFSTPVAITDAWAVRQLTPPESDPRYATRRIDNRGVLHATGTSRPHGDTTPYSVTRPQPRAETTSNAGGDTVVNTPLLPPVDAMSRVDMRFALYDLSRDEVETASALVNGINGPDPRRLMRMAPTHNINAMGELNGYRFSVPATDSGSALPINRTMFHGTSSVQCTPSVRGSGVCNLDAVRLLADTPWCIETMRTLMDGITLDATNAMHDKTMACFACSPCSTDVVSSASSMHTASGPVAGIDSASRARDSRAWVCDEPTTIGIYHAWVRRANNTREHQLVIICTGGCRNACDEFMNITSELAVQCKETTAAEICDSEEVWWLRKLCSRMRSRLLYRTAEAFGLKIPAVKDIQAFNLDQMMAVTHTETCTHDITNLRSGEVAVFNGCVDTTTPRNGMFSEMNPSEGFWLFKGPTANSGSHEYGGVFGKQTHCGIFPTSVSRLSSDVHQQTKNNARPFVTDFRSGNIVVYKNNDVEKHINYAKFDECFMQNLQDMSWHRDNEVIVYMPIVMGVFN
jgi:hypothetical protein